MSTLKGWLDYFLVVFSAFSLAAWGTFTIGFGLENDNPDKLVDQGWRDSHQRPLWYMFSLFGLLAGFTTVIYSFSKKRSLMLAAVLLSCIALFSCGGPLDGAARFIWDCQQEDETGKTHQGPGCQEQTYDNHILMLLGAISFAICQTGAMCAAAFASSNTKFSFHSTRSSSLNEYPLL
eukprot:m.20592 g.20592  ORF g.20592 m.20592 type:complete len:178 (-) comp8923_c0_seq1:144-677(-)